MSVMMPASISGSSHPIETSAFRVLDLEGFGFRVYTAG